MECILGLVALLGLVFIATGVLYYRRPDIQWRVQKWYLEFWGSIQAEQGENWGCWSRVGALVLIGTGLWILWTGASGYSQFRSSNATHSASLATYTAAAAISKATVRAAQPDIAALEEIFAPLMPALRSRALAAPGEILLFSDAERRRYGLADSPVYFGICGDKSLRRFPGLFYVIVENWGPTQAEYQYACVMTRTSSPDTDCGSWLVYSPSNRSNLWVRTASDSFDYAAELQRIRSAATATRHFGPAR
jgi:hypothetical protein